MGRNKFHSYYDDCFDVTKLKVKLFVIGYGLFGESILILFLNENVVFYSIVIDSYHYKNGKKREGPYINKTIDLLKKYKVENLNILCWTHPHDDHSKGIPRLIKHYCNSGTKILYPMYLQNNATDIVEYGDTSKQNIESIHIANREKRGQATPIGLAGNSEYVVDEFYVLDSYSSDMIATVRVDALTPISSKLTEYLNYGKCKDPNELSITLVVDINGYGFYFGGDATNEHINLSKRSRIRHCKFVKIPHHASRTAKDLVNYLPATLCGICTTVFKKGKSNLPDKEIIALYRSYGVDIYSTNKLKRDDVAYGIIEYNCDFSAGIPEMDVRDDGISGVI